METPGVSPQSRLWYPRVPSGPNTKEAGTEQPHWGDSRGTLHSLGELCFSLPFLSLRGGAGQQASSSLFGECSVGAEAGRSKRGGHGGLGHSGRSYALLALALFLAGRGLVLAAIGGCRLGHGAGAAAGGRQEVGRLQDGLRVLTSLHAQGGHAGRAVGLAAVGGEEGKSHGVGDTTRAQGAPWKKEEQQAAITVHISVSQT